MTDGSCTDGRGRARRPGLRTEPALVVLVALTLRGGAAYAIDPFEIQVYDPDVNAPGHLGLELHSIFFATGHEAGNGTELPLHQQLHETLEPSLGLGHHLELGGYLQTALRPDGVFSYAGVKVRLKWHIPVPEGYPVQFGLNTEVSNVPSAYDAAVWGAEIRPIVTWHPGAWVLSVNPIVTFAWTGPYAGIPAFEPCASLRYEIARMVAPGLEYYAAFGPVSAVDPWAAQGHYVFETLDVIGWPDWEVHVGVGEGLTAASQGVIVKASVGHGF